MLYFPDKRGLAGLLAIAFAMSAMAEPLPWASAMSAYRLSDGRTKDLPVDLRNSAPVRPDRAENIPWLMRYSPGPNWPLMFVYDEATGKMCQIIAPGECLSAPPSAPR